jgi:hypothetical protein
LKRGKRKTVLEMTVTKMTWDETIKVEIGGRDHLHPGMEPGTIEGSHER